MYIYYKEKKLFTRIRLFSISQFVRFYGKVYTYMNQSCIARQ